LREAVAAGAECDAILRFAWTIYVVATAGRGDRAYTLATSTKTKDVRKGPIEATLRPLLAATKKAAGRGSSSLTSTVVESFFREGSTPPQRMERARRRWVRGAQDWTLTRKMTMH
jgi:hypothetical protein